MSKVDIENVKKRILAGETYKSIGESYGVTKQWISSLAKQNGLAGVGVEVRRKKRAEEAGFNTYDELEEAKSLSIFQKLINSFTNKCCTSKKDVV